MISIKNLNKSFGKHKVLDDINIEVNSGQITALAGPNGSGKTTLVKAILGLVKPDSGQISIDGANISDNSTYRENIGYMPQINFFPENLSSKEILLMIKDLRNISGNSEFEKGLIEEFELEPHLDKKMNNLSGGTRQKISLVLALMTDPKILILDEASAGLDPASAKKFKDTLRKARNEGKTIILISHILSELEEFADNIIFIIDGKILVASGIKSLIAARGASNLENALADIIELQKKGNLQ
ncbi:MAG: ABC transporter ATP-binding protein [Candidatus Kapabacteria bacterium]|nr:ABC transporter ATP-binding protein [Candidatus Kapabacteria bacterium]